MFLYGDFLKTPSPSVTRHLSRG